MAGFTFDFTKDKLQACLRSNKKIDQWYEAAAEMFPDYELTTPERVAHFIAQTGHESADWTIYSENLNYSAAGLQKIFKKYFPTMELAKQYAKHPGMIANRVYANRMGNGDEKSGDGYLYRGRGLIQLTGKSNYQHYADDVGLTLEEAVEDLEFPDGALESACWYWHTRGLNRWADKNDITTLTKRINGGDIGLADRKLRFDTALSILRK